MSTRVVRSIQAVDELVSDDGALVLVARGRDSRVVRISPMGHLIRELAAAGITVEHLTQALASRLGFTLDHDVQAAVLDAISSLQREGLVTCDPGHGQKEGL